MMSADSSGDERNAKRRPGKEHEDTEVASPAAQKPEREKRERAKAGNADTTSTSVPAHSSDVKRRKAKPKSSDQQQ